MTWRTVQRSRDLQQATRQWYRSYCCGGIGGSGKGGNSAQEMSAAFNVSSHIAAAASAVACDCVQGPVSDLSLREWSCRPVATSDSRILAEVFIEHCACEGLETVASVVVQTQHLSVAQC